ncbi:ABC transporter C family member 8 [Apostasia shenzhenica]|uniref:ABC transporter C family member 8 n=1 Tax=Apostasia shenzhenica TaxID=1088818 RepID=A0A2I0B6F7_9ASPA|nr:ABC transporter C family member 8 [Apostasia shenzhenica]
MNVLYLTFFSLQSSKIMENYYLASSRELVRINGTTKAPIMNHAGESLLGVVTTRRFKTTLISALFRLAEPSNGQILVDDINICSIGLKDLRMKLGIIPQEPTLFRGSIRTNLDPLGLHTDQEIWEVGCFKC